jgi:hypothetical protein
MISCENIAYLYKNRIFIIGLLQFNCITSLNIIDSIRYNKSKNTNIINYYD